jgi:hypothetical protein
MFVHQNKNLLYVFKVFTTKIERTFRVAGSQRTGGTLKCIAVRPQDVLLIIFRTELSQVEAVRQSIPYYTHVISCWKMGKHIDTQVHTNSQCL